MRSTLACAAAAAVVLCLPGLAACGGTSENAAVLRIGDEAISKATVDHWVGVVKRKGAFSGFRGEPPPGPPMRRALSLLVSSNWLIGEAARQNLTASAGAIDKALSEREQSPEFQKALRTTGQTVAGVKLEMRAELASEAIRQELASRAGQITTQDVASFYRKNQRMFSKPEERVVDLLENRSSSSAAAALVRRIGTGQRFAKLAYREQVSRTPGYLRTPEKVKVVDAIFSARTGVVSPPIMLNHSWAVFVVRRVIAPRLEPLASVRAEVVTRLNVSRQHEIASQFDRDYTARWRGKTRCLSGYVAPGCPQSHAPLGAYEDPFSTRAHPLLSEQAAAG